MQNFFNQENFLNLTLPGYEPQTQNMQLNENINMTELENNQFIDPYDGFQDVPMMVDLTVNTYPVDATGVLL